MDHITFATHVLAGMNYGKERTCGKKVDYKNEDSASKAAKALSYTKEKPLEAYPCVWCNGWHIGRTMTDKEYTFWNPANMKPKDPMML